jgi:hypothetical protein
MITFIHCASSLHQLSDHSAVQIDTYPVTINKITKLSNSSNAILVVTGLGMKTTEQRLDLNRGPVWITTHLSFF